MERDAPFSMEIKDSDDPNSVHPLLRTVTVGNKLLAFSSNAIYEVITANSTDPLKQFPRTKHTYKKLYSIGCQNSLVARVIIQFDEMLNSFSKIGCTNSDNLRVHIWEVNEYILICETACFSIYEQTTKLMVECDDIIEKSKKENSCYIPALPIIKNLEQLCDNFLTNAKKFIVSCYRLLELFYGIQANESDFHAWREQFKKTVGDDNKVYQFLETDKEWCKYISGLRNAREHSRKNNEIIIENFKLQPNNKFSSPRWKWDLSERCKIKAETFSDIVSDMDVFLGDMLTFFEVLLLLCIEDQIKEKSLFKIGRIPDKQINPDCPILYSITLKEELTEQLLTSYSTTEN